MLFQVQEAMPAAIAWLLAAAAVLCAATLWVALRLARTRASLRESEERFRGIVERAPDLVTRQTETGIYLYCSRSATSILGFEPEELVGRSVFELVEPEDLLSVREYLSTLCRESFPWAFSYRIRRKDGRVAWIETSSTCEMRGDTREIVAYSRDVTERKRVEDHIAYLAYHDELTGLPNRTLFQDRLTIALAHARRFNRLVGVLFLDLDHFKRVNDTLGHALGDQLLDAVATRLRECIRISDTVARLGGDEFTLLLSEISHEDDVARIARKVLDAVSQRFTLEGHHVFVGASIGIALHPRDGDDAEALLKNADSAMYRAKNGGRGTYSFCTPETNARFLERLALENSLRRAFEREEFELYYQPVFSLASGRPVEMEALIRWNDPERGLVSPGDFLAVAEDSRLMLPIGEWVLRSACRQARLWADSGNPIRVSVNLSARQLHQPDLEQVVARAVRDSGIDSSLLHLEVTEKVAAENLDFAREQFVRLRGLGVKIAIDDFGGGTASFGGLQSLPIDRVKIDSRMIGADGERQNAILSGVIAAAQALDLSVVAKSVESPLQYEFLQQQNCDQMQGYLFGRPLPAGVGSPSLRMEH